MIRIAGMQVRIELDGMFGIGSCHCFWPGFSAHAVEWDKPFLSHTGYRGFLGIYAAPEPGYLPDAFVAKVIHGYVECDLKGKLEPIGAEYRERHRLINPS